MNTTTNIHLHPYEYSVKLIHLGSTQGWAIMLTPSRGPGSDITMFIENPGEAYDLAIAFAHIARCRLDGDPIPAPTMKPVYEEEPPL